MAAMGSEGDGEIQSGSTLHEKSPNMGGQYL